MPLQDTNKKMNIEDAVEFVKKNAKAKFDSTIEVHINTSLDKDKQETVRFSLTLPHGVGKTRKVAVMASEKVGEADLELTEDDIGKIESGQIKPKGDFDVLIVEPRFMPKLAKVAKILGPVGMMPNPKNGTVADDIQKAVSQFKKGKIEVRNEPNGSVIHSVIGKKSFSNTMLIENFNDLIVALKSNKPQKSDSGWLKQVFLTSTMGSSVEVEF